MLNELHLGLHYLSNNTGIVVFGSVGLIEAQSSVADGGSVALGL